MLGLGTTNFRPIEATTHGICRVFDRIARGVTQITVGIVLLPPECDAHRLLHYDAVGSLGNRSNEIGGQALGPGPAIYTLVRTKSIEARVSGSPHIATRVPEQPADGDRAPGSGRFDGANEFSGLCAVCRAAPKTMASASWSACALASCLRSASISALSVVELITFLLLELAMAPNSRLLLYAAGASPRLSAVSQTNQARL